MEQNKEAKVALDVIVSLSPYGDKVNPGMRMCMAEVNLKKAKFKLDRLFSNHRIPEGVGNMTVGAFLRHWKPALEFDYSLATMTDEERGKWIREQREEEKRRQEEKNRMVQYTQELRSENPELAVMVDRVIRYLIQAEEQVYEENDKDKLVDIERELLCLFKIRSHYSNHSANHSDCPEFDVEVNHWHLDRYLKCLYDRFKHEHDNLRMKYQQLTGVELPEYGIIFIDEDPCPSPLPLIRDSIFEECIKTPSSEEQAILDRLHQLEDDLRSLECVSRMFRY